jgi:hypothetical protein
MSVLTTGLRQGWEVDGWCIIGGAVPADRLQAAQRAVAKLFPSAEEMAGPPDSRDTRWSTWDAAWPEFPFRSRSLNWLVVSDLLIDAAAELLATDDVRMYLAIVSAKYAGQPSDFNRLLHVDFPNHTLTVPRPESGYHQVEFFVYLNDVGRHNGATRFVSRRHTHGIPVEEHTLNLDDHARLYGEDDDASGPAGSIVIYRPDVYHRSVDFSDPTQARFMLHVSYKPADLEWGGYQAWPIKGFSAEWHSFVQGASPRQLGVLGFPEPGHVFWTDETLAGVARRYPGLDLTPWRVALSGFSSAPG